MADKNFSVDDILNEYADKVPKKQSSKEPVDLDALMNRLNGKKTGPKTEVIEDVLEVGDNSYAFEPDESELSEDQKMPEDVPYGAPTEADPPEKIVQEESQASRTPVYSETINIPKIERSEADKVQGEKQLSDPRLRRGRNTESDETIERVFNSTPVDSLRSAKEAVSEVPESRREGPDRSKGTYKPERPVNTAKDDRQETSDRAAKAERSDAVPPRQDLHRSSTQRSSEAQDRRREGSHTQHIPPVEETVKRNEQPIRPLKDNDSNTAIIEGLMKLKKERGAPKSKASKIPPVNRASIDNIELDLESKILPNTEIGLDENATEEERLAYLNAKRRERVKQFVISSEEEEPSKDAVADFTGFEQAQDMAQNIASLKAALVVRLCVLLVTSVVSAYVAIANDLRLPIISIFSRADNQGMPYIFANVLMGLAACFVSYTVLAVGVTKLFTLKADSDSLAAVAAIFTIGTGIALLTDTDMVQLSTVNIYISVAIIGLLINTIGKLLIVTRTERNFRYVSGGYSKYAALHIDDEDVASKFTKGALTDFPSLTTSRKTEFVSDFIKNSYSADMTDSFCRYYVPIITVIALVVGVIGALLHPDTITEVNEIIFYALSCASGTIAICSAAGMMLVTNIPLAKASKKYLQSSAVMLGYSAVDKFADTNSVLIDAIDLFPDGMVEIINIKPTRKTPIEDGIIYAASLCCQTESILRPAFYKMIKGKTEMLFPVESYIYEDGLGLSGWVQNKRVLFGNRALMESHSIEGLPTHDKEGSYCKDGASLQYLSIGGSVAMIFVIKLKASVTVSRALSDLERNGVTVILRSVDSLLSITKIAELFGVAPNMFKLLPFRFHDDYDAQTSYVAKMSSPMIYSGHFASFAMLLTGAKRLQKSAAVGVAIQLLSAILGVILSVVLVLVGSFFSGLSASAVIGYTIIFTVITVIVQAIAKT